MFGGDAIVRLFGSRIDDDARGGDIDLHIELPAGRATVDIAHRYRRSLRDKLGERKIDVVIAEVGQLPRAIDTIALAEGIVL